MFECNNKLDNKTILEKGILINNNIFIHFEDNFFYIQESPTRCFKCSLKRAKNSLNIKDTNELFLIFVKNINNIKLEKKNNNLIYLTISYYRHGIFYPSISSSTYNSDKNIKTITDEKKQKNYNTTQKIKLKEINDFLFISKTDNHETIIKKQHEKIITLLSKINELENKLNEPSTDDEFITNYT